MTNQDLYLPIELARPIAPIAKRLRTSRDGVWCKDGDDYYLYSQEEWVETQFTCRCEDLEPGDLINTYRADKLLNLLGDIEIDLGEEYNGVLEEKGFIRLNNINTAPIYFTGIDKKIENLLLLALSSSGPAKLKALAELLILLDKEKLL